MLNNTFRYEQTSARLEIEGLPDYSIGQEDGYIGIVSSWRLDLVGSPQLEGKLEHLQALISVVLPYARHKISEANQSFGELTSPVCISSYLTGHKISLRSSQKGIKPLDIHLDDAELADLVRCLDDLRLDPRVKVSWEIPIDRPLSRSQLFSKLRYSNRIAYFLIAVPTFLLLATLSLKIPIPKEIDARSSEPENKEFVNSEQK